MYNTMEELTESVTEIPNCFIALDDMGDKAIVEIKWDGNLLDMTPAPISNVILGDDATDDISPTVIKFGRISYKLDMDDSESMVELTFTHEVDLNLFVDGTYLTTDQVIADHPNVMVTAYMEVAKHVCHTLGQQLPE
jgi:hypothetical protein